MSDRVRCDRGPERRRPEDRGHAAPRRSGALHYCCSSMWHHDAVRETGCCEGGAVRVVLRGRQGTGPLWCCKGGAEGTLGYSPLVVL